ncbi:anti-sigma factor [Rhizobium sp. SL86]|uniref:anti-sigma factor n=1 Tax=Rhizobium sp. SL86 TaxID=2995148 RepID=UPI002276067A|nr:anti-sigma factor [Rhizobium sp. SL86]MCY1664867.1 anti-sigma factor [Rhizobium sp. SL86]
MTKPDQSEGDRSRDEVLAGEYVLGVLSLEARERVEARLRHDRAFAAIVARWQENLATLEDEEQAFLSSPLALPVMAGEAGRRSVSQDRLSLQVWRSASLWRGVSFALFFLLVGTILFAERPPVSPQGLPPVLASMQAQAPENIGLLARYDAAAGRLQITPVATESGGAHSLEVWLSQGTDPAVSLGTLPETGEVIVPQALRGQLAAGGTLSVSLEPPGGSTTGKPSGPVLAIGHTLKP